MNKVLEYLTEHLDEILGDLTRLVEAESPSLDKELVDQCGRVLEGIFNKRLGVKPTRFPQENRGDHLLFTIGEGEKKILIAGHFDTVWDQGRLPLKIEDGKFYGPGVLDMKSGIIQSIWAIKACQELGISIKSEIAFLCTTDEEIGSQTSRALIEEEARKSDLVLIPEPPESITGALKTSRKGVGIYHLKAKGKSTHAGNDHKSGVSAIKEIAHQILKLEELTNYSLGTTVNVGVVNGGTRSNVVPDEAEAMIDFRVETSAEAERLVHILENLSPIVEGAEIVVDGELNRPPMERTEKVGEIFEIAKEVAEDLGYSLSETKAGGASDGNFTAYLGIPTIDGLGCLGDGPHAEHEHIVIEELPKRAALFSCLLMRV